MAQPQTRSSIFDINLRAKIVALVSATALATLVAVVPAAQGQTFTVLHTFRGTDGLSPHSGVTMDASGNLYGTTTAGGAFGDGTVYQLKRHASSYVDQVLYSFTGGNDGKEPYGGVVFGPDGILHGTTTAGGQLETGTVLGLQPPSTACETVSCAWTESLDYTVPGGDNQGPLYGQVAFDQAGNIYGTTTFGGTGYGAVYEVTQSGDGWNGSLIYQFQDSPDGNFPPHNLVMDGAGNLYGTTNGGGFFGSGTVFQLVPAGLGWSENILVSLDAPCAQTLSGVIMDRVGNLYGGGTGDGNTACVFELSPSGNGWQFSVLHTFTISNNGSGPVGNLVVDSGGNLYGATQALGAFGMGNIFKLSPSGGNWAYTDLYDFSNSGDGEFPTGDLQIDSQGNLYGTNTGASGHGVVWKLTP